MIFAYPRITAHLYVSIPSSVPAHLTAHPSLAIGGSVLLTALLSPNDHLNVFPLYLFVPKTLVPQDIDSAVKKQARVDGGLLLHSRCGHLEWHVEASSIDFDAESSGTECDKISVSVCNIREVVSDHPQPATDAWVIHPANDPEEQFW